MHAHQRAVKRRSALEPLLISIAEAAEALGLGKTSIYALIEARKLERLKIGRRTLIKLASIRQFMDSLE